MYGDYVLLCTDGLSNMVDNDKILEIVNNDKTIESKVEELIEEANFNGGRDNIALILLYVDSINKENSVFDKEKRLMFEETKKQLDKDNKNTDIKEILKNRISKIEQGFKSRSRKKKEGDINE